MDFLWVGNHPGIDLCNTAPVVDGRSFDLLSRPEDLDRWLREAHVAGPNSAAASNATLAWTHRFRTALTELLSARDHRYRELKAVNALLTDQARPVIETSGQVDLHADDPQARLRLDLTKLAAGAIALDPTRVRQCAENQCVLLFFDTSRSGTRRWHDMATCGNRAKAASHHARRNR